MLEVELDKRTLVKRCDVTDAEILAFAIDSSLAPWINRPHLASPPVIATPPDDIDLEFSLNSFSHNSRTFEVPLGAISAKRMPAGLPPRLSFPAARSFICKIPDGARTVAGKPLFSQALWDHWLGHRNDSHPPRATSLSPAGGRPLLNFLCATRLSSLIGNSTAPFSDQVNPLAAWIMVRDLMPGDCTASPRTSFDLMEIARLADRLLASHAIIYENPIHDSGPVWRKGPRFPEILAGNPHLGHSIFTRLSELLRNIPSDVQDALWAQLAEQTAIDLNFDIEMEEPSGHAILHAAALVEPILAIKNELIKTASIRGFLGCTHRW